jgi:hypothetical protein
MLLGRENKNSTGNLLKTLANPLKTPTYVPPIRGFDKPMKPFYSPNEGSHPKAFNFQTPPSPRRDSFKVLQPKVFFHFSYDNILAIASESGSVGREGNRKRKTENDA